MFKKNTNKFKKNKVRIKFNQSLKRNFNLVDKSEKITIITMWF